MVSLPIINDDIFVFSNLYLFCRRPVHDTNLQHLSVAIIFIMTSTASIASVPPSRERYAFWKEKKLKNDRIKPV